MRLHSHEQQLNTCTSGGMGRPRQLTGVVSDTLTTFMKKEYVVDKLDRKGFTHSRAKSMYDAGRHQAAI